jgi:transketolase
MRDAFIKRLHEIATKDERIFLITGDLGFGVLTKFSEDLPDQYLNVGVAEQNMTGVATGMALDGRIVFTYSIGNFPTLRCLEQVRNDACYHNADVKIVCVGGGYSYGVLGMSHHATEDLSIMRALPNMTVIAPASDFETEAAVDAVIARPGCCYLRIERTAGFTDAGIQPFVIGRARRLRDGDALTLIGTGAIMSEVLAAADDLAAKGIECRVLSYHTLKPLDIDALAAACRETGGILTVEENVLAGGLGSAVAEACLDNGLKPRRFHRLGVRDQYSKLVGSQDYLRKASMLDRASIAAAAAALLTRTRAAVS